jgi:type IV pilus assembly protein PilY1
MAGFRSCLLSLPAAVFISLLLLPGLAQADKRLSVSYTSDGNGTVVCNTVTIANGGSASFANDAAVSCTMTAAAGSLFVGSSLTAPSGPFTSTNPAPVTMSANKTLYVNFTQNRTVAVTQGANGTIACTGAGCSNSWPGSGTATYSIAANAGYAIQSVTLDGVNKGALASISFAMGKTNHTLTASFVALATTNTVSVVQGANGVIACSGAGCSNTWPNNGRATYSITANAGYVIQDVLWDGVSQGAVSSINLSMMNANHTLTASFALLVNQKVVTVTQPANGLINPGTSAYNPNTAVTFNISCNTAFKVSSATLDGVSQGAVNTVSFNVGLSDHTLTASCVAVPTYTVTTSITGSGSVTPDGGATVGNVTTVNQNSSLNYTIIPAANYAIRDVRVNGVSQPNLQGQLSGSIALTNITQNYTVSVSFDRLWTISASVIGNGSMVASPAVNPITVLNGDSKTLTITAGAGSTLQDVTVDGAAVALVGNTYTFNNVTANHAIVASFQAGVSANDYSSIPPILNDPILPNLLLMFDNSGSMYDLAYTQPAYSCYDESYNNSSSYAGYFDQTATYSYDWVNGKFNAGATIPGSCDYRQSFVCVNKNGAGVATDFIATGKFLNWLSTSKLDLQKLVLTGGKYDTVNNVLVGESRGCEGGRYIKVVPAMSGVTFATRGPVASNLNTVSPVVQGGQAYIEILSSPTGYPRDACLAAAQDWFDPNSIGDVQAGGVNNSTAQCVTNNGANTSSKASAFNHTIHSCYRALTGGNLNAEATVVQSDCNSVISGYYGNNPALITNSSGSDAMCSSSIEHAPSSIDGVSRGYLGDCYPGWDATCYENRLKDYCGAAHSFDVLDPSGGSTLVGAATVPTLMPHFLMDAGAASLGDPIGTAQVRVALAVAPSGLIDQFSSAIQFGVQVFNFDGSGSECGVSGSNISCAKNCQVANTLMCYTDSDCPANDHCVTSTKMDGGQIVSYNGYDPVGNHSAGLIKSIDDIRAYSWTPWAESYYDAIGYFANRADLRLQTSDFDLAKNPSAASCRANNIMIISDGESTADQNSSVRNLASAYDAAAAGTCTGLAGSKNLSVLAALAKNKNIATFSKASPASGAAPQKSNEFIVTYAVYVGTPNASADRCTGQALMNATAASGGTGPTAYQANDYDTLYNSLYAVFGRVASAATSGTAASIVNNRGTSGTNLLQAVFYPKKTFGSTTISWIGEMQNLWYYLDPYLKSNSIREDTNGDRQLDLRADRMVSIQFDVAQSKTLATWFKDETGLGNFAFDSDKPLNPGAPDQVNALWKAGAMLQARSAASRTIHTTVNGYSLLAPTAQYGSGGFTSGNKASLEDLMGVADADAGNLINYVRGLDFPADSSYRSRTVSITYPSCISNPGPFCGSTLSGSWKLGDIIASTPQAQPSSPLHVYDTVYGISSYTLFTNSADYKSRGMVYVGANDSMLHAFRLGQVSKLPYDPAHPSLVAKISNPDNSLNLGDEEWAFIPKNALPYLQYLRDPNYTHLYFVNNTVALVDASLNCATSDYWNCTVATTYSAGTTLDKDNTSWRTVLIGGMGLGGASRDMTGYCNRADGSVPSPPDTPEDRLDCVKTPQPGIGNSSFFALDVTDPKNPSLKWEFSDADIALPADKGIGFATSGPAIVRISAKMDTAVATGRKNNNNNGRWFAVFGSGPTGPTGADNHYEFMGRSDQTLKIYVVDMNAKPQNGWVKGTGANFATANYWVIDTGIANAFAGSISDAVIDADRWNNSSDGFFGDDVVYLGYTRPKAGTSPTTWTDGGVIRLLTKESLNPADWEWSTVIDGIGPVTTAVGKLQDRKPKKQVSGLTTEIVPPTMWLYFGTGRNFFKTPTGLDDPGLDDNDVRGIFGIKEQCYNGSKNAFRRTSDDLPGCAQETPASVPVALGDLKDQSTSISAIVPASAKGWYIKLDHAGTYATGAAQTIAPFGAERVITDPTVSANGVIFITSYRPASDICSFGGDTLLWALDYDTGAQPPANTMTGKMLMQTSTGSFTTTDLSTAFIQPAGADMKTRGNRRLRSDLSYKGTPPASKQQLLPFPSAIGKIIHIQEK